MLSEESSYATTPRRCRKLARVCNGGASYSRDRKKALTFRAADAGLGDGSLAVLRSRGKSRMANRPVERSLT